MMKKLDEPQKTGTGEAARQLDVKLQTWGDRHVTIVGLVLLLAGLLLAVLFAFLAASTMRMAFLVVTAMLASLVFGYGIASLLNPLDQTEATRFPRIVTALGGVVSGFTLAKAGEIATFVGARLPAGPGDFVDSMFLVVGPLAAWLVGLMAGFVVRTAQVELAANQRLVAEQEARAAHREAEARES
jgi:hypothetical protein